ncbi:1673_t:CDS:2, partial [Acaulospora colombiana]
TTTTARQPRMKRPAIEQADIQRPRTRRRVISQQALQNQILPNQPHASLVADDESILSAVKKPQESPNNTRQNLITTPRKSIESTPIEKIKVETPQEKPKTVEVVLERTVTKVDDQPLQRRPLRRLRIVPLKDPAIQNGLGETDSTLSTPIMSPVGLRAPPCSPSRDGQSDRDDDSAFPPLLKKSKDSDVKVPIVDLAKIPPSPTPVTQLLEPDHTPPTPPYYVQHFEHPELLPYDAERYDFGVAAPNANTYTRKARFQKSKKRQKNKGVWSFTNCEEYPRGETPLFEIEKDDDDDDLGKTSALGLSLQADHSKEETDMESDDEAEILRDPGIPISLAVGIDSSGRYVCRWGDCNKTFARNDHLEHRCDPCGIAFIGVRGLRNHEKQHVGGASGAITHANDSSQSQSHVSHPSTAAGTVASMDDGGEDGDASADEEMAVINTINESYLEPEVEEEDT